MAEAGPPSSRRARRRFGKVFFSIGRSNYVCSGTATNSTNGDVVTTAGHCVSDGGTFVTNFAFVPAYNNGARAVRHLGGRGSVHHDPVAQR